MKYRYYILLLAGFWAILPAYVIKPGYYLIDGAHDRDNVIRTLRVALALLDYYEKGLCAGVEVSFFKDGKYFDRNKGPNWWEYYFEPLKVGNVTSDSLIRPATYQKTILSYLMRFELPAHRAHELLHTYIKIQPILAKESEEFIEHFAGYYLIGVYYEKSKHWLQSTVSYQTMYDAIVKAIPPEGSKVILLSKDPGFTQFLQERLNSHVIVPLELRRDAFAPNYIKGFNLLASLMILSLCNTFITVAADAAELVGLFNPSQPNLMLNEQWLLKE